MDFYESTTQIIDKEWLTDETFVLRLERNGFNFHSGQYVVLEKNDNSREYSLCNGLRDDYLEVLIRNIPAGSFTPLLSQLKKGDTLTLKGPLGFFVINPAEMEDHHYYFIATGVGISPFLSFIRSYPDLDYTLLHGIRFDHEAYRSDQIPGDKKILCTSRDKTGDYHGRVTGYIRENNLPDPRGIYYLCGNSAMIEDVSGYLEDHGIDPFFIRSEVFF